jgi:soluble lytic murein transglycosylase-like protein
MKRHLPSILTLAPRLAFWSFLSLMALAPPPARAELDPITPECLAAAAQIFEVPYEQVFAVLATEGGQVGRINFNKSGTYDVGPMQINSTWLPILKEIGLKPEDLRDNGCANVVVGVWILRLNYLETGDREKALAFYHSRDPKRGRAYVIATQKVAKKLDPRQTLNRVNALIPKAAPQ